MKVIEHDGWCEIRANLGYRLKDVNDHYIPKHYDNNGNLIEEHKPTYFDRTCVGHIISVDEAMKLYNEEYDERSE